MKREAIAVFGETEKKLPKALLFIKTLPELVDKIGEPNGDSQALHISIQSLLYERPILFYQIREEGMNEQDYFEGFKLLKLEKRIKFGALALPGVSSNKIIDPAADLVEREKAILIMNGDDLYDFITS